MFHFLKSLFKQKTQQISIQIKHYDKDKIKILHNGTALLESDFDILPSKSGKSTVIIKKYCQKKDLNVVQIVNVYQNEDRALGVMKGSWYTTSKPYGFKNYRLVA